MTLARRLRAVRKHLGHSQREMAAKLGVPYRTYQAYEQGQQPPKMILLDRLGEREINLDWLVKGRGEMKIGGRGAGGLEDQRLRAVLTAVEEVGKEIVPPLTVDRKVRLMLALYDLAEDEASRSRLLDPAMVRRLCDLAG